MEHITELVRGRRSVRTFDGRPLRPEDLEKLRYIAKEDCRSVSGTIRVLVNHCIQEFEKEHGEIL